MNNRYSSDDPFSPDSYQDDEGYEKVSERQRHKESRVPFPSNSPISSSPKQYKTPVKKIQGTIIRETERAILFSAQVDCEWKDIWFPLSQVKEIHRTKSLAAVEVKYDELVVTEWILKQKDMI